jgi:ATP-dependent DNA helicase RecG
MMTAPFIRLIASAIEQGFIESESDIKPSQMGENEEENTQKPPKMGENEGKNTQKWAFPTLTIMNVYELICRNPKIKYVELQDNLGVDDNTVHRSIAWLKENGYINKEHSKVKGVWQLI